MAKKQVSFQSVMKMKEDVFFQFVADNGHAEQIKPILRRKTEQKVYPKVLKPSKKIPEKMTYQADKTQKPKITVKPITFFEVKSAYCEEVLKLEKKQPEKKETFRERWINM